MTIYYAVYDEWYEKILIGGNKHKKLHRKWIYQSCDKKEVNDFLSTIKPEKRHKYGYIWSFKQIEITNEEYYEYQNRF